MKIRSQQRNSALTGFKIIHRGYWQINGFTLRMHTEIPHLCEIKQAFKTSCLITSTMSGGRRKSLNAIA